jgi:hypothetical protein
VPKTFFAGMAKQLIGKRQKCLAKYRWQLGYNNAVNQNLASERKRLSRNSQPARVSTGEVMHNQRRKPQ